MLINRKELITHIKESFPEIIFKDIQKKNDYDYDEGKAISYIFTFRSTPIPMLVDIKEEDFDDNRGLESWCYFLKKDGSIDNELDYDHFDGGEIVNHEQLKAMNYDQFALAIADNISYYSNMYDKHMQKGE